MEITVGVPHTNSITTITDYPIVRQDGRIIFVEVNRAGIARVMRPGARRLLEQHGDDHATAEAAIEAAKALLAEMP